MICGMDAIQGGGSDIAGILVLGNVLVLQRLLLLRGYLGGVLESLSHSYTLRRWAGTDFKILNVFLDPLGKEQ